MASDIDLAVRASRAIETHLTRRLGAEGKGLHEKLSSVAGRVGEQDAKDIRFVATIRNKVVHEDHPLDADVRASLARIAYRITGRPVTPGQRAKQLLSRAVIAGVLIAIAAAAYAAFV